jgi:hypothetical protein
MSGPARCGGFDGLMPVIPRWLLIGTAICILIPDLILLYQLTPAFRHSHQVHPDIRAMVDSPAVAQGASMAGELLRPMASLFFAVGVLRRRFLTGAAIYITLRIVAPLLLAFRVPQVFGWSFAPIFLHILALVGIIYVARLHKSTVAASEAGTPER